MSKNNTSNNWWPELQYSPCWRLYIWGRRQACQNNTASRFWHKNQHELQLQLLKYGVHLLCDQASAGRRQEDGLHPQWSGLPGRTAIKHGKAVLVHHADWEREHLGPCGQIPDHHQRLKAATWHHLGDLISFTACKMRHRGLHRSSGQQRRQGPLGL